MSDYQYFYGIAYRVLSETYVAQPNEKIFLYKWLHIPSGKTGTQRAVLMKPSEIYRLINGWNQSDDWKYTLI